MTIQYTPAEYIAEMQRQSDESAALLKGLDSASLNWQPNGGKSWSVGQCLDHLIRTNTVGLAAMRAAVESNRDQLEQRQAPMQPAGWFSRWFVGFMGPNPSTKVPAPSKIVPPSQVADDVAVRFAEGQKSVAEFVAEFKDADLGGIRYQNPLASIVHFTVDTGLLVVLNHNQRHLVQAERVKKSPGFPQI